MTTWTGGDEVARLDADELKQIARDIYGGAIYVADEKEGAERVAARFMPLGLGALAGAPKSYLDSVGLIFEYLHKAGPLGLNGGPMFMSVRFLHKQDLEIVRAHMKKLEEALDG